MADGKLAAPFTATPPSSSTSTRKITIPATAHLRPVIPQVVHKFLDRDNPECGFARLRCDHCCHEYLLSFGRRWFCSVCHRKNVQTIAVSLTARVLVPVNVRLLPPTASFTDSATPASL